MHLILAFMLSGCFGDVDLRGFFYSSDAVNKRFEESMTKASFYYQPDRFVLDTASYAVYAIGDVHVGKTANLNAFLDRLTFNTPAFYVIAGDLTTGKEEDMVNMKQTLTGRNFPVPFYPAVGNHDLYFDGWPAYLEHFGSASYWFNVTTTTGKDMFIFLDTGSATLGKDQSEWLEDLLKVQRENHRYCIIVTHTNLFRSRRTTSTNPLVEELYFLMDLFAEHHVDLVITGHDHKRSEERLGFTRFVTLDALEDGYKNASYLSIQAREEGLSYEFIPMNP